MITFRRIRNTIILLLAMNLSFFDVAFIVDLESTTAQLIARIALYGVIGLLFLYVQILPAREKDLPMRIYIEYGAHELMVSLMSALTIETLGYFTFITACGGWFYLLEPLPSLMVANGVLGLIPLVIQFLNTFLRACFTVQEAHLRVRLLIFFFWLLFPIDLLIAWRWCVAVREDVEESLATYDKLVAEGKIKPGEKKPKKAKKSKK